MAQTKGKAGWKILRGGGSSQAAWEKAAASEQTARTLRFFTYFNNICCLCHRQLHSCTHSLTAHTLILLSFIHSLRHAFIHSLNSFICSLLCLPRTSQFSLGGGGRICSVFRDDFTIFPCVHSFPKLTHTHTPAHTCSLVTRAYGFFSISLFLFLHFPKNLSHCLFFFENFCTSSSALFQLNFCAQAGTFFLFHTKKIFIILSRCLSLFSRKQLDIHTYSYNIHLFIVHRAYFIFLF